MKYDMTIHAEMNAILTATESLDGCTMYSSLFTCSHCAKHIIQSGIKLVVAPIYDVDRWEESLKLSKALYDEAGVSWKLI